MEPMIAEPPLTVAEEPTGAEAKKFVGLSPGQLAWKRLKRNRVAIVSAVIIIVMFVVAYASPLISSIYGVLPTDQNSKLLDAYGRPLGYLTGITGEHWLGVEQGTGRDIFMQTIYGMRTSLSISFIAAVVVTALGVVIGAVAGYFGGWVDSVISWLTDLMLGFPFLIFAIAALPVVRYQLVGDHELPGWLAGILIIGIFLIFGWMGTSRLIRGQVIALREREFVEAARASGAGPAHILFRQILPNVWAPILVSFSMGIPGFIATEAALSFLGIGVTEPTPDLGRSISTAVNTMSAPGMWFWVLVTGGTVFTLVLAFNLFGDAVRDALDPKSSR